MAVRPSFPRQAARLVRRLDVLALFPLCAAISLYLGAENAAWVFIFILPILLAIQSLAGPINKGVDAMDKTPGSRREFAEAVDQTLAQALQAKHSTAVLTLEVEDLFLLHGTWGAKEEREIMARVTDRVRSAVRGRDIVARCGDTMIAIVLAPIPRADMDIAMGLIDRLQKTVSEPLVINGRMLRARCSIGVCTADAAPAAGGAALVAAAECALGAARRMGDGAVRLFTPEMQHEREVEHKLADRVDEALSTGELRAWFQPQVSTDTGAITGFEVLARWHHPELGVLTPANFLPAIRAAHAFGALGEAMLDQAINALIAWDRSGLRIPCVGLNLSLEELRDPKLAERVMWQVDRYDLKPERFCIEILESVALADGDEAVVKNLSHLRTMGFRLDLDDFGTGQSSIAHVAKFGVDRIKIDRSFVSEVDQEPAQKRVLAAILAMADQLGIDTLAEGVETPGEHTTLAQLGCTHVQGYAISRPIPFEDTLAWATKHNATIVNTPMVRKRKSG